MILNWRQTGYDGRTPHERVFGRPYAGELFKFCCHVQFQRSNKPDGGLMTARWSDALWLGKTHASDEHVVCPLDGTAVTTARSVRPLAEDTLADHMALIRTGPRNAQDRARTRARGGWKML